MKSKSAQWVDFWNAVRKAIYELGIKKVYRPYHGYSYEEIWEVINCIAVQLGHKEGDKMTDYNEFTKWAEQEEEILAKSKRCSTSNHFGMFMKHLVNLRHVLKSAEKDGYCLDELVNSLKDFEEAIKAEKSRS